MKTILLSRNMVYTGDLILVNRDHPYREESSCKTLISVDAANKNVLLERRVASVYNKLMSKLKAESSITEVSGWRSQREQERIYSETLLENGADFTAKYVALPGHSEHQTGLAVDLALNQLDIDFIRPYFPYTGICGAFREMAGRYGFIERYPKGKENITSIAYEPWHFRYVGVPHAMIMEQMGDTLEEYHTRIRQYSYGRRSLQYDFGNLHIEIYYLPADKETVTFNIGIDAPYTISGNNMDGFVVTVWRAKDDGEYR